VSRNERAANRSRKKLVDEMPVLIENEDVSQLVEIDLIDDMQPSQSTLLHIKSVSTETDNSSLLVSDSSCQTSEVKQDAFLSFANLSKDNELLHYYTGLENSKKLQCVFESLGPAVNCLTYYRTSSTVQLSPINQFIVMLAKLRQDVDYLPLSKMSGISEFTAHNVFVTWVNFCSRQWSEVQMWPEKVWFHFLPQKILKKNFRTLE
jgi:hypothetical protein